MIGGGDDLFNQVENAVYFYAEVNNPYSTEKVITTAYQLIYTTGMLLNDWKIRKHHPEAYKSWEQFNGKFSLIHHKLRDAKVTYAGEGYQSTNALYHKYMINTISKLASGTGKFGNGVDHIFLV